MTKLNEIISKCSLEIFSPPINGDVEVEHGYTSDMLSDVIANAGKNYIWITMQTHVNTVAVAALKDIAAIILVNYHKPSTDTIETAKTKGICLLGTVLSAFDISGRLYAAGLRGGK